MDETKSSRVNAMNYDYKLVMQESDHENHIPTESDFFVVENSGRDVCVFCRLDNLLKGSRPYYPSRQASFDRCLEWLKNNYPEFML